MAWFVVRQRGADAARGRQQEMARSSNTYTHDCSTCLLLNIPNCRLNDAQQEEKEREREREGQGEKEEGKGGMEGGMEGGRRTKGGMR